jgi:membrane-associated protein
VEWIKNLIDFILHIDHHLDVLIQNYGAWTHGLLFLIVFCETGLVITPFLPGDSLLFAVGAFAARGSLDLGLCLVLLIVAAILGDTVNYAIGKAVGPKVFHRDDVRFLKREHLVRAHKFYEKYGGKAIILARFVPIVRTFAPFVAGIGTMTYSKFVAYNVIGGVVWVLLFVMAGYWFGNLELVRKNFTLVILAIIILSILPAVWEVWKAKRGKQPQA